MKQRMTRSHMDGMLILLLTSVFAVCVLLVLLSGADSYRSLAERDAASYDQRICCEYVAAKIRHADGAGRIWVGDFSGTPMQQGDTLILAEEVDGTAYWTRVYYYDGWVRELYCAQDYTFSPEDGDTVLKAQSLQFTLQDDLLTVQTVDASGNSSELSLALRSGGEASA